MKHISHRRAAGLAVIASLAIPNLWYWWYTSPVLDLPILLQRGEFRSPNFTARRDGDYFILLQLQNRMDQRRLDALLGERSASEKGRGVPSVMNLSWTLWNGGEVVATSNPGWLGFRLITHWSKDTTGRSLGQFCVTTGKQYNLSIDFQDDPSELNTTNPRLVIKPTWALGGIAFSGPHDSILPPILTDVWTLTALIWGSILLFTKRSRRSSTYGGEVS